MSCSCQKSKRCSCQKSKRCSCQNSYLIRSRNCQLQQCMFNSITCQTECVNCCDANMNQCQIRKPKKSKRCKCHQVGCKTCHH